MKPILFSTPMVQAIMNGRKTVTRRVVNPQPIGDIKKSDYYEFYGTKTARIFTDTQGICAKYALGDILWVRETWRVCPVGIYCYKATGDCDTCSATGQNTFDVKWRPSIFMPREAARIFLRVTDVRIERLQEITEEQALREGSFLGRCPCMPASKDRKPMEILFKQEWCHIHDTEFKKLWNDINAKRGYGWNTNPWVQVVEFERTEKPE